MKEPPPATTDPSGPFLFGGVIVVLCAVVLILKLREGPPGPPAGGVSFRPLAGVFEPSGVVQLPDGRLLVVEDEAERPLTLLRPAPGGGFVAESLELAADVDDLEDVAVDAEGFVYATTSFSRRDKKRRAAREKLIRFRVGKRGISDLRELRDLRDRMTEAHPLLARAARVKKKLKKRGGLNVEGLAFDGQGKQLLLGLRAPLSLDGRAVLVVLENPRACFVAGEPARIGAELLLLDLGGRGVRGLTWDRRLGGYLVLARDESKAAKKGKDERDDAFTLWLWRGAEHVPQRVAVAGDDLRNAEGITPARIGGEERLLVVSDEGDAASQRPARYRLFRYDELRIGPAR